MSPLCDSTHGQWPAARQGQFRRRACDKTSAEAEMTTSSTKSEPRPAPTRDKANRQVQVRRPWSPPCDSNNNRSTTTTTTTSHKLLATIAIVLPTLALVIGLADSVCPGANDIRPCTCDDEGLQCLRLNNSGLARVFRAPAELKAIRRVWIFQTNLTALEPQSFGDYIIRDLYLDLNQISRVAAGAFGEATKTLQSLSLTRNQLTSFPFEDLKSMKKLKQLGLGHNQLKRISANAFPPSDVLESIDLSHNSIETIEPNAFVELHEVSLIDLSRNHLRQLDSKTLAVKSSSRHLAISLRANRLSSIAFDAFGDHHPHTLDLSRNHLTYLEETTFGPLLMNHTLINVDENPFSCSGCELYRWLLEMDREYLNNLEGFTCEDETKLEDLTLDIIGCEYS